MDTTRDLDRSFERLNRGEEFRSRATGYGTTRQGRALTRQYQSVLADRIMADRALPRDRKPWRALKDIEDETLALRLLVAGISVCGSDTLGADKNGEKNFRDIALWIGRQFDCEREIGLKVGAWGINMLLTLPVFALADDDIPVLKAEVNAFMDDVLVRAIRNNPLLSPLTTPPQSWTDIRKGGLPPDHWAHLPLIRSHHPSIEIAAREAIRTGQMQKVLDAVNALQAVAYTINEPVLDFIRRLGHPTPNHPNVSDREQQEAWAKLRAWEFDMVTAEAMACCERFYVPLNIDFRGRLYGVSHFNFAREDHVRGLFLFADGKPIGDDGLFWLKTHVAARADGNTWSKVKKPSKLHPKDQVLWTKDNLQTVRAIGEAALAGYSPATLPWSLPEAPCQFIAACVELVQALDAGPDFVTRLPITVDASCSGLQHLCAMTRAEEGKFVNLTPSREGDDFYTRVAKAAYHANPDVQGLMDGESDRAIVKRPAMSYFYGSRPGTWTNTGGRWRPFGMTKQIADVLKERKQSPQGATKLALAIYRVIEKMVPKAKAVREFLEQLAKLCAENGKPLRWTTPLGLPVINRYHEPETEIVSVSLNGRRRRVKLTVGDRDGINKKKAANAVTANFTHSVDASHLQLVALAAANKGIEMLSVHDCFGTAAPDVGGLGAIIREQFIRLHELDLLNRVRESAKRDLPQHVELPSAPEPGNLNLEGTEGIRFSIHAFK
jgi:DNA-directed RNA polymerase